MGVKWRRDILGSTGMSTPRQSIHTRYRRVSPYSHESIVVNDWEWEEKGAWNQVTGGHIRDGVEFINFDDDGRP